MDINIQKINFVQEFLKLNNERVIKKFLSLLSEERKKQYESQLHPMSNIEYNQIIDQSEKDVEKGRVREASSLKKEIDSWE